MSFSWCGQSYEIKSPPWTILWFIILGIFSVENIQRLCVFRFQTSDNVVSFWEEYCESVQSWPLSQVWNIKTHNYIFNRVRVLYLDKLKEGTWLHSFVPPCFGMEDRKKVTKKQAPPHAQHGEGFIIKVFRYFWIDFRIDVAIDIFCLYNTYTQKTFVSYSLMDYIWNTYDHTKVFYL